MDMLIELLGGGALGAIVGTAGAYFTKRQSAKHEQAMAKLKNEATAEDNRLALTLADKEITRSQIEADRATLSESMRSTGVSLVDTIRAVVRPVITLFLLILATYLSISIAAAVGGLGSVPEGDLFVLYTQVLSDIMLLTNIAVTWWFGSRPSRN